MAFRVKDLLINVGSTSRGRRRYGMFADCDPFSITASTGNCITGPTHGETMIWSRFCSLLCCGALTAAGPGPVGPGDPVEWAEQLAILKADLKEALAEVERQERAVEETLKPRDVAEVEELEGKLNEALTELERIKAQLKRK